MREEKKNDAIVVENDKALLRPDDKANVHQCIIYMLNSCSALGEDIPSLFI